MLDPRSAPVTGDRAVEIATLLDAAVFPLKADKSPALALGWREASATDGPGIKRLWAMAGGLAYVGVDCGKSGLVVIDIDEPEAVPTALLKALAENPTLVFKSLYRGGDHYYYRGLFGGRPIPGGDIKGIGGYVLCSVDADMESRDIVDLPHSIRADFDLKVPMMAADGKPTGDLTPIDPASRVDVDAFLYSREGWLHGSEKAGQAFLDRVIADMLNRIIGAGEHRRMSAMNAVWAACKEVEAGFYSGWAAHDQLREAYKDQRDADPNPAKRWNRQRETDYEAMWQGAIAKIQGGQYDDEIAAMRRDKLGDGMESLDAEGHDSMDRWLDSVSAGVAGVTGGVKDLAAADSKTDSETAPPKPDGADLPSGDQGVAAHQPGEPGEALLGVVHPPKYLEDDIELPVGLRLYRKGDLVGATPELDDAVFTGLVGEVLKLHVDATEASIPAIGGALLPMLGAWLGRGVLCRVGDEEDGTDFPPVVFTALVGTTSKGRKGTAVEAAWKFMDKLDPDFAEGNIKGGSASGEDLIHQLKDPEMIEKAGVWTLKSGTEDQRLCLTEAEFTRILVAVGRTSSTMSPVLRTAYDRVRALSTSSRSGGKAVSTNYHVCVTGAITPNELLAGFDQLAATSGLGNRFAWIWSASDRLMPDGARVPNSELTALADRMRRVARGSGAMGLVGPVFELGRSEDVAKRWREGLYAELRGYADADDIGVLLGRASDIVLRIATVYAACDGASEIQMSYLDAGLAWERYSRATVSAVLSGVVETPLAAKVLSSVRAHPGVAVSKTELWRALSYNITKEEMDAALIALARRGLLWAWKDAPDGGRAPQMVVATVPVTSWSPTWSPSVS